MADEKEAAPKEEEKHVDEAAVQKKRKMIFWGIIAGIIVLEFPIMWVTIKLTRPKSAQEIAAEEKADSLRAVAASNTQMGATTAENPIEAVVNVAGTEGERFLKVGVAFEFDSTKYKGFRDELARRKPKIKALLVNLLSQWRLVDLTEPGAQQRLAEEYRTIVNRSLPRNSGKDSGLFGKSKNTGQVSSVLIQEFIIQ